MTMPSLRPFLPVLSMLVLLCTGCGSGDSADTSAETVTGVSDQQHIPYGEATDEDIVTFCSGCHVLPDPESFPREVWKKEVLNGYFFMQHSGRTDLPIPHYNDALAWYQDRAPEFVDFGDMPTDGVLDETSGFERIDVAWDGPEPIVAVTSLVVESSSDSPQLLMCDMSTGTLWRGPVGGDRFSPVAVAQFNNPCRIEATDLDQDGREDYLIADLGSFQPEDHHRGVLWWCQPNDDTVTWTLHRLRGGLARICDMRPLDYDRDGDLDLVVAEFGWHKTGDVVLLTNLGLKNGVPQYESSVIDERHGAVHLPVTDLNHDGWPDFVALLSQQHELIEGFVNDQQGGWTKLRLGQTDNPSWGASGAILVDLDGDGDEDVLTSHGDTMDSGQATPAQGVTWWENQGAVPYVPHKLTTMPGCYAAVPGDLDGDGDLDIAAVSYLSLGILEAHDVGTFDSVIWLEQTDPGVFGRHFLEENHCNHVTCHLMDWDGDGRLDILTAPCDLEGRPTNTGLTVYRALP